MSRAPDSRIDAALDRFDVPSLPGGFTDRVVAAAALRAPTASRRDRRGSWSHRRRAAFGVMAVTVMSATAAAAGLFGNIGITVPALERFVDRVTAPPAVIVPQVSPRRTAVVSERTAAPDAEDAIARVVVAPKPATPAAPPTAREVRREAVAQKVADRIDRRERLGLPVDPRLGDPAFRPAPALAARFPERAALVERIQEIRQARREGEPPDTAAVPPVASKPDAEEQSEREARRRRFMELPPGERAERLRRLGELRQRRQQMRRQRQP